jgi:hypothetical protein
MRDCRAMERALIAGIAIVLALPGCSTYGKPVPIRVTQRKVRGHQPEHRTFAEVQVGDVMYTEFDFVETQRQGGEAVYLDDGFEWSRWNGQRVSIEPGYRLSPVLTSDGTEYCTREGRFRDVLGPARSVCFLDRDSDGYFNRMAVVAPVPYKTRIDPTPYRREMVGTQHAKVPITGFKKELIYQGRSGEVLKIQYREFLDDLARPAFYQDINYDFSPGGIIAFQSARIEVVDANNLWIKYRVLAGWE